MKVTKSSKSQPKTFGDADFKCGETFMWNGEVHIVSDQSDCDNGVICVSLEDGCGSAFASDERKGRDSDFVRVIAEVVITE